MRKLFKEFRLCLQRLVRLRLHLLAGSIFVMSCAPPELSSSPRGEPIFEFTRSCGENSLRKEVVSRNGNATLWSSKTGGQSYVLETKADNCFLSFDNFNPNPQFPPVLYETSGVLDVEIRVLFIDEQRLNPFGSYDFMMKFADEYLSDCDATGLDRQDCLNELKDIADEAVNIFFDARTVMGHIGVDVAILDGKIYYRGQRVL